MEAFLTQYGLLAVLLCALVENDVTFILAGVVCEHGLMHPAGALLTAIAGALVHDSLWYLAGRRGSEAIQKSRVYRRVGPLIEGVARRVGPWELFVARFFYGTRNPSALFWGVQRLPFAVFLGIELVALTVWGGVLTALGYWLSDRSEQLIGGVKKIEHLLLAGALIALLIYIVGRLFTKRTVERIKEQAPDE